jgi:hypothetical protein
VSIAFIRHLNGSLEILALRRVELFIAAAGSHMKLRLPFTCKIEMLLRRGIGLLRLSSRTIPVFEDTFHRDSAVSSQVDQVFMRRVLKLEKCLSLMALVFNIDNSWETLWPRCIAPVSIHEFERHLSWFLIKVLTIERMVLGISMTSSDTPPIIPLAVFGGLGSPNPTLHSP